jgi:hypothetical protein
MGLKTFEHTFYDIDIETQDEAAAIHLIKILSVDGRRFTYEFRGELDAQAVSYIKSVIDANCVSDMLIERQGSEFNISEARQRLKKHS